MLFKGTSQYGSLNWEKEQIILDQIAERYEQHRNTTDSVERRLIYRAIDSLSVAASHFAIPNAYDKMTSSMGAKGTNAYTSTDETVYLNDIPSNELERWAILESERFSQLVLRLFHTEMETVYEEFNRAQDNDRRWAYQSVLQHLYPNHPYGNQTTIGTGEHLKNPSMLEIHKYFDSYYVPSNMAICLSGNLDPAKTINLLEKYFGAWEAKEAPSSKEVEPFTPPKTVLRDTVYGPNSELVYMGYGFDGSYSKDHLMVSLIDMLLANGKAGLIDLDLLQNQKVLSAGSFVSNNKDYTTHFLYGIPRGQQTLKDVENLLVAQLDSIKNGSFSQDLLLAVKNDMRVKRMKEAEGNRSRAMNMTYGFVYDVSRDEMLKWQAALEEVSRQDIIDFAKNNYTDNYAITYKVEGESNRHKVPKPPISKVHLNRESTSPFRQAFNEREIPEIEPVFLDFEKDLPITTFGEIDIRFLTNDKNDLFELYFIFDVGSRNLPKLQLAFQYFEYLGTEKLSPNDIKRKMYTLGVDYGVTVGKERSSIYLKGLSAGMVEGLRWVEMILRQCVVNPEAYQRLVQDILKSRDDAKKAKRNILWRGLASYARYGEKNPYTNKLTKEQLESLDPQTLVDMIHQLVKADHRAFYRGPKTPQEVISSLEPFHTATDFSFEFPEAVEYPEKLANNTGKVFYVPYPMQQTEMLIMRKSGDFNPDLLPYIMVFNEYFGSGLSSIVFQEIREQRGLAYAAYTGVSFPSDPDDGHLVRAYLGTQADKTQNALQEMQRLLTEMPLVPQQFEVAKQSALKSIRTDWVKGSAIYWAYERAKKRGILEDLRREAYGVINDMTIDDLSTFFKDWITGEDWVLVAIGPDSEELKQELASFGPVETLSLDVLFP